jgi:hypothetical protein
MGNLSKAAKLLIKDMANCPMLNGDEDIIATVESGEYKHNQKLVLKVAERVFNSTNSCVSLPSKTIVKHLFDWLRQHDLDLVKLIDCAEETLKDASWNMQYILARNPHFITKEHVQALEVALELSQALCNAFGKKDLQVLRGEMHIAQRVLHAAQNVYTQDHPVPIPKPGFFAMLWNWLYSLAHKSKDMQIKRGDSPIGHNPLILTSSMAKILVTDVGKRASPQIIPVLYNQNSYTSMQPTPPLDSFAEMKI